MKLWKKRGPEPVPEPPRAEFCDICGDIADGFKRCERHAGWVFKAAGGKFEQR